MGDAALSYFFAIHLFAIGSHRLRQPDWGTRSLVHYDQTSGLVVDEATSPVCAPMAVCLKWGEENIHPLELSGGDCGSPPQVSDGLWNRTTDFPSVASNMIDGLEVRRTAASPRGFATMSGTIPRNVFDEDGKKMWATPR